MRLLVYIILFAGALGIFKAATLLHDGERSSAWLVFALSAGSYLAVAVWWYTRKPGYRERRR